MRTRVLLADEMVDIRQVMQLVLEDAGYHVLAARGTPHALEVLRTSTEPMVVLLSKRSGTELLEAGPSDPRVGRHAFVLLCAYPQRLPANWGELLAALNVPVLALPFDLDTLYRTVGDAIRRLSATGEHPLPA